MFDNSAVRIGVAIVLAGFFVGVARGALVDRPLLGRLDAIAWGGLSGAFFGALSCAVLRAMAFVVFGA